MCNLKTITNDELLPEFVELPETLVDPYTLEDTLDDTLDED